MCTSYIFSRLLPVQKLKSAEPDKMSLSKKPKTSGSSGEGSEDEDVLGEGSEDDKPSEQQPRFRTAVTPLHYDDPGELVVASCIMLLNNVELVCASKDCLCCFAEIVKDVRFFDVSLVLSTYMAFRLPCMSAEISSFNCKGMLEFVVHVQVLSDKPPRDLVFFR